MNRRTMTRPVDFSSKTTGSTTASRMALKIWHMRRRTGTLKSVSSHLARVRSTSFRTPCTMPSCSSRSKTTAASTTSTKAAQRSSASPVAEVRPSHSSRACVQRFRSVCIPVPASTFGPQPQRRPKNRKRRRRGQRNHPRINPASPSKLGVKTPCPRFSRISSGNQKRPPSSSPLGRTSPS